MIPGKTPFRIWFDESLGKPTAAQAAAWPLIRDGNSVLIVSPPGTGKTLAAFLEILDQLATEHAEGRLVDSLHCLYVSPLRALGYDLSRNLRVPLDAVYGDSSPIRVELRSGDTPAAERERQRSRPPHILLTTPESLSLMLSQSRWCHALRTVRWVIVDEIHSLAENKRGAHLSLSLERLEALPQDSSPGTPTSTRPGRLQRIGLSATVFPVEEAAQFLVGTGRHCEIVSPPSVRQMDLQVYTPLRRNPYPPAGYTGLRMLAEIARLIQAHRTTLIFTNTRSGAEATTQGLKRQLPALAATIECHHASLDRDLRLDVEDRLKRGELRAVVCSTSLELGIDIGSIDLVVMLGTPKGVSRTVQRAGRAGHRIHAVSRALLMATNVNDLVECAVMARLARQGCFDRIRIPAAPLDVLAQHLMGLGCLGTHSVEEAFQLVRKAWPYHTLARADFERVMDYLAGGGRSLERQYSETFGKIVRDRDRGTFESRDGAPRRDFLQNVGTIPSDGSIRILLGRQPLGSVEESFLRRLQPGDIFSLAGRALRLTRTGTMEAWVERADGCSATVPRWGANKMPLSSRVAEEIHAFRLELRSRMVGMAFRETPSLIPWIAERLECDLENATVIFRIHATQAQVSEIPTSEFLLIEELVESPPAPTTPQPNRGAPRSRRLPEESSLFPAHEEKRWGRAATKAAPGVSDAADSGLFHYFFHSVVGRSANDALSRVVALRLSASGAGNIVAYPDDYGFALTLRNPLRQPVPDWGALLSPEGFETRLSESLGRSELLKYHFRNAAQTGLMVYRNFFGSQKSLRKVQWSSEVIFNVLSDHEPDHVLMQEAMRETLGSVLDSAAALDYLRRLEAARWPVRLRRLPHISPLSFCMHATRMRETLILEDPSLSLERLYHQWWSALHPDEESGEGERLP